MVMTVKFRRIEWIGQITSPRPVKGKYYISLCGINMKNVIDNT